MADLKPVGINLITGQLNYAQAGDVLRPDEGNLTISSGSTQTDGTTMNVRAGDGNPDIDAFGGSVNLIGGFGSNNGDGGFIVMTGGDSGLTSGSGGGFFLEGGNANTQGSGGGFEFIAGDGAGAGPAGGSIIMTPGTGYDHGSITFQVQGLIKFP